jgi:hypothetical protein
MRSITIVGAGQAGLQLGIGLLDAGYDVTIASNRTPEQIRDGKVMSSQCMFDTALAHERAMGLDFWSQACPPVQGIGLTLPAPDGGIAFSWDARLDSAAQSVDQRVKMPRWMAEFEARGGKIDLTDASLDDLETYATKSDLVVVAAGKGDIAKLFERDAERSTYDKPQRSLALTYVHGMAPRPEFSAVSFNLIPGVGEYFTFPALTTSGPCDIMVFEGIPGGPLDCWTGLNPTEHLANSVRLLDTFLPWEADRVRQVELTDANGVLAGRFPPTIRRPVATLPSGRPVLGLADVVVLNDPITGQGSNNASRCAQSYLASILGHGDQPYDAAFMQDTFESYYAYARYVVGWTNALLAPPPPHILTLLRTAAEVPAVAKRFAEGFNDPKDFFDWFMDPKRAADYLARFDRAA